MNLHRHFQSDRLCQLADENGALLAETRGSGANLQAAGELQVEKVLHDVMTEALAAVTSRNRARFVSMQVSGVLTAHADHFILRDLAYDPVDCCIEIRMADTADGRCGLTRTIGHAKSIIVSRNPDGRERALEIMQDRGITLILFLDDVTH